MKKLKLNGPVVSEGTSGTTIGGKNLVLLLNKYMTF